MICHEEYKCNPRERTSIDVGVDSGQAGFYDFDYYRRVHPSGKEHLNEGWYERVCESTLKAFPNPHYISEKDYIRNVMGASYMELYQIETAESSGTLSGEQAKELRNTYLRAYCDYKLEHLVVWPTVHVGYAGILDDCCCVASSGYGDGGYDCCVGRNKAGQIVSARIQFI